MPPHVLHPRQLGGRPRVVCGGDGWWPYSVMVGGRWWAVGENSSKLKFAQI